MFWIARQPPECLSVLFVARNVVPEGLCRAEGVREGVA